MGCLGDRREHKESKWSFAKGGGTTRSRSRCLAWTLLLVLLSCVELHGQAVRVWEGTLSLPTYALGEGDPEPAISVQLVATHLPLHAPDGCDAATGDPAPPSLLPRK